MGSSDCLCNFIPCVCIDANEVSINQILLPPSEETSHERINRVRAIVAANATEECHTCLFVPCICPPEENISSENIETKTSPINTNVDEPQSISDMNDSDEEVMDHIGRVLLTGSSTHNGQELSLTKCWIPKEIKRIIKPHQIQGVSFMYSNLQLNQGCILADYMGLGKTLQVVTTIYSYLSDELTENEGKKTRTAIVLCPAICLPNWELEFNKWLQPKSRSYIHIYTFAGCSTSSTRISRLREWGESGGVFLVGYEMFRNLLHPSSSVTSSNCINNVKLSICTHVSSGSDASQSTKPYVMEVSESGVKERKKSINEFYRLLCEPGADVVVLDEGHRMKDPTSLLCQSVNKIQTRRRLVLTGYPLQNSLSEYWCMVNFARKGYLGTYEQFRLQFEKPILDGNKAKSNDLVKKLQSIVLRRGKCLLQDQIPPKKEWIVYCKLSQLQEQLYTAFLDSYGTPQKNAEDSSSTTSDLLTAYSTLLLVMNHPDMIYNKLSKEVHTQETQTNLCCPNPQVDEYSEWAWESTDTKAQEKKQQALMAIQRKQKRNDEQQKSVAWAQGVFPIAHKIEVVEHSGKMVMLMGIIRESFAIGDKVVVFSQSVPTLEMISVFLKSVIGASNTTLESEESTLTKAKCQKTDHGSTASRRRDPAGILRKRQSKFNAAKSRKRELSNDINKSNKKVASTKWFLQIDGSTSGSKRMEYIDLFSAPQSPIQLLLVSTRAGAEGINLHAANRLVLFDVSWNPSNDHQSMCRSHRIGQTKIVHVYRLVSTGTMERLIYEQQVKKVDLSTTVVDKSTEDLETTLDTGIALTSATTLNEDLASTNSPLNIDGKCLPLRGFLQPPKAYYGKDTNSTTQWSARDLVQEDQVLTKCLIEAADWVEDIQVAK